MGEKKKMLTAVGIDEDGEKFEFDCSDGWLHCSESQLTELILPEGVKYVNCYENQLTELILPEGIERIDCDNNKLTELIFPEGVTRVSCRDNNITHLTLPSSFTDLWADKEITGLERYMGKIYMDLY